MACGGKRDGAGRPVGTTKPPSVQLAFRLSQELADRLAEGCKKARKTRSRFVQEAIVDALARLEQEQQ